MSWMTGEGKILSSFEAVKSSEGGDSWSLSPSERKPEQGQYRAGIYRTGICRSQNLILEVWKADWSDSISCIHLESYKMKHLDLLKRKSLFFSFLLLTANALVKVFVKATFYLQLQIENRRVVGLMIMWSRGRIVYGFVTIVKHILCVWVVWLCARITRPWYLH